MFLHAPIVGSIQARIDKMGETDQMVIKSASVYGKVFSREMIEALMPHEISAEDVAISLLHLCLDEADCYFQCAYKDMEAANKVILDRSLVQSFRQGLANNKMFNLRFDCWNF